MTLTVKLKGLQKLRKLERKLHAPGRLLSVVAQTCQEETLNLISDQFEVTHADPYSKPWKAPNNLQIGGQLRSFTALRADSKGWVVAATDIKAIWHHSPGPRRWQDAIRPPDTWRDHRMPTRRIVPVKVWPKKWSTAIQEVANEAMAEFLSD